MTYTYVWHHYFSTTPQPRLMQSILINAKSHNLPICIISGMCTAHQLHYLRPSVSLGVKIELGSETRRLGGRVAGAGVWQQLTLLANDKLTQIIINEATFIAVVRLGSVRQ